MTRWLVCVPEGDEVKYVRLGMDGDKLMVCDLDALAAKIEMPVSFGLPFTPGLFGIPLYDAEIS